MIACITGASAGFGKAIAESLLSRGHHVIICARRKDKLAELHNRYSKTSYPLVFDVGNNDQTQAALDSLPDEWRSVDLLVNNAGLALGIGAAHTCDLKQWHTMVDTNIKGLLNVTHALLPGMVERNRGHIINLGSIAGDYPYPGGNVYGASKAFVKQFSLNLRADLVGTPIRVTNLEPGLCGDTEFSSVRFAGDADKVSALYDKVDYLTPQDIAETVLWVAERPAHVNINRIELMPVAQAPAALQVARKKED